MPRKAAKFLLSPQLVGQLQPEECTKLTKFWREFISLELFKFRRDVLKLPLRRRRGDKAAVCAVAGPTLLRA